LFSNIQSYTFDAPIWNLVFHENENQLIAECRTTDRINYYRIDLKDHTQEKLNLPAQGWMSRLEAFNSKHYVFKSWKDKSDPSNHQWIMLSVEDHSIQHKEFIPHQMNKLHYPHLITEGNEDYNLIKAFLEKSIVLDLEYYESEFGYIISYYVSNGDYFSRFIVHGNEKSTVFDEIQNKNMKGFSPDAFCVFNDQLIFVHEDQTVCVYQFSG
jgi:hypothetical protein